MAPYKKSVNIACSDLRVAESLSRYLNYCLSLEEIAINPLSNPYKFPDAVNMAEKCDMLIVDAFIDGEPKGFQFAKQIGTKTLILFYSGEFDIDDEGPFWLVFTHKLCRLSKKIMELMEESPPVDSDYIELENKFPVLRKTKDHHE